MTRTTTEQTSFTSGSAKDAARCAAWLTLPTGSRPANAPHPVVVLVHGGGATHDMGLPAYEQAFAGAGLAVLAFDFRHLGSSGGEPRGLMSPRRYLADVRSALDFVRARPELDAGRIALWGTSFGASHVVATAARHPEVAAAVVQCPVFSGRQVALHGGLGQLAGFTGPIVSDLVRAATGRPRRYLPIVGRPGERAFVNQPGAWEGWHSLVADGSSFDNRVPAAAALDMLRYHAAARLPRVRCPLLVCVSDRESLIDPASVPAAAATAPKVTVRHYPADHFDVYHQPLRDRIVADQLSFLTEHLGLG
ncbi:MAG TPA: alpha/beta fold hydrolase [Pseudonocardia sp.]|nr:alpha/beta fold hydrolase [Pseudonocardia sp.]